MFQGETPEDRLLNVTRWYISTLYGSYSSRATAAGMEKKPYNPILGEQYFAQWPGDEETGDIVLEAEQVSHHPPIMAFHIENKKAGVILEGHCGQKTRFAMPAGIDVHQTGHAVLTLTRFNETYLITLPSINVRGLITGRPSVELSGSTFIVSSAEQLSTIEYSTKGYFSGERHSFKATLKSLNGGETLYTAQGIWSGLSTCSRGTKKGSDDGTLFFDAQADRPVAPELKSQAEMGPLESHKLWAVVTKAINVRDYGAASRAKAQIEEAQRVLAKDRKERGETQADALKIFELVDEDADATGRALKQLRSTLLANAGPKALREDEQRPHWRLRK
ncbi:Oxysterol binding protein [Mortierella alpina]|uniref:Oxysterol binding protein n=1 Tax=Mortierella alpina TaxID=64518 RepID=A0A9P6JA59_MORAP|nr:Oxysterol binding protein [Mortierella alpina]